MIKRPDWCATRWTTETWIFMLLRLFLALRWLCAGYTKFVGADGSVACSNFHGAKTNGLLLTFTEKTPLPKILLYPYIQTLPYVELLLGLSLLLGLWSRWCLILSGLFYVSLAFGQMLIGGHDTVHAIAVHLILVVIALHFSTHGRWNLRS